MGDPLPKAPTTYYKPQVNVPCPALYARRRRILVFAEINLKKFEHHLHTFLFRPLKVYPFYILKALGRLNPC